MAPARTATCVTARRKCDHCGRSSTSLFRCSRCKSAWYCDRTCQSLAWDPPEARGGGGHRLVCSVLRREKSEASVCALASPQALARSGSASSRLVEGSDYEGGAAAMGALRELAGYVQGMDREEAYRRMCLAQDEIRRLQLELNDAAPPIDGPDTEAETRGVPGKVLVESNENTVDVRMDETKKYTHKCVGGKSYKGNARNNAPAVQMNVTSDNFMKAGGSWLDQGGNCSVEYLPNVKCYQITLTCAGKCGLTCPRSIDELRIAVTSLECTDGNQTSQASYHEARLYQMEGTRPLLSSAVDKDQDLILSIILLTAQSKEGSMNPTPRVSIDASSISLRLQLQHGVMTGPMETFDLAGILLGSERSNATESSNLNYLHCRVCQNPIVQPYLTLKDGNGDNGRAAIQHVLPLPSGHWEEIADYMTCYEGRAAVDFASSSDTSAIQGMALEDDVVLVLHRHDLAEAAVRAVRIRGYGERSSGHHFGVSDDDSTSKAWVGGSAADGEKMPKTLACANCCSTLGFISNRDGDTYRLYKHLLGCDETPASGRCGVANSFSRHTVASFLAREMVRHAEVQAVYTFVVGVSDENDWTRMNRPGEYLFLRLLSWDVPMALAKVKASNHIIRNEDETSLRMKHTMSFRKIVKVIFEESSAGEGLGSSERDDFTTWIWGGTDLCCPDPNKSDGVRSTLAHAKVSSVRIFFSRREFSELRNSLICGSKYFSNTVKDAAVMAKLGPPGSDQERTALLSFLPLVH